MKRILFLAALSFGAVAHSADYGKTTQGASFRDVEIDLVGTLVTLPGGETGVAVFAYLQTTNGSTADCKAAFYDSSTDALAYQTNQVTFSDDVGSWRQFIFTTTVAAGSYYLSIGCGSIGGGTNTVNIAYDTVTLTANLRESSNILAGGQSTYPTLPATVTWGAADNTQDISVYFRTAAASTGIILKRRKH